MRPTLPVPPPLRGRPFTTADAEAAGVPTRRLAGPSYRRLYRDVYVAADLPVTLGVRCAALGLVLPPSAVFSHVTALSLAGLTLPSDQDDLLHVSVPRGTVTPRRREGVVTHERVVPDRAARMLQGFRVTGPSRIVLDLALLLRPDELVAVGDHLARRWTSAADIRDGLAAEVGQRHVRAARAAAALVRDGVDSPQETRARLVIVRRGFPEPVPAVPIRDDAGSVVARGDLGYEAERVVIQYEGDVHRTERRRWRQDRARDELARDLGWLVLLMLPDDVAHPAPFLDRLGRALLSREGPASDLLRRAGASRAA